MSTSNDIQTKQAIEAALKDFAGQPLAECVGRGNGVKWRKKGNTI